MTTGAVSLRVIIIGVLFHLQPLAKGEIPTDSRKDALVSAGIDGTCRIDSINIKRYDIFPGYSECGRLLDSVKKYNPNSIVMLYNSGTDNYTTPGITEGNYYGAVEHNWLTARCVEMGYSPEILYLHFYGDTKVSGWTIPGTYSVDMADSDSVSRAPDYLSYYQGKGIGRILVNYAHPITRQLQIEYACMLFDSLENSMWKDLNGRQSHFDGIYLDNWMHNWGRHGYGAMGLISSGGRVAETPGANLVYGTADFAEWYWEQMKLFAAALRDTLAGGGSWTQDKTKKYLSLNVGQSWHDDYANPDIAGGDFLVMEYLYNPVHNPNASIYGFEGMASRDSACALNGVSIVYCSRQEIGENGEFTWGDAVYNNMVSFYGITSGESYLFQRAGLGAPYTAQYNEHFDSLAWRGCMDYDLGNALEHYEVYQTGTDPRGQYYKVFSRNFEKGLVMMRPLNDWDEVFDAATKISVNLPGAYRKLNIDGSLGPAETSIQLQNGAGAVLIPIDMGDWIPPPIPLYPAEGDVVPNIRPEFGIQISQSGEELDFYFQVADNSEFLAPVSSGPISGRADLVEWIPAETLKSGKHYFWRARAANSAWCDPVGFSISAEIHVSPNPYRPLQHEAGVVFRNIPDGADIKILTINGDVIREFTDLPGPELRWDVTSDRGRKLASGVYLYYVITDGTTVSGKLAIIKE
ncbi:MAG TPA: T9SS type A sorting domain-containing protein [candidate division Zixibacteria bacterium]|nr:T9SS type A sorting domain-containing protein [candidate division Zixibacteria bacterium]